MENISRIIHQSENDVPSWFHTVDAYKTIKELNSEIIDILRTRLDSVESNSSNNISLGYSFIQTETLKGIPTYELGVYPLDDIVNQYIIKNGAPVKFPHFEIAPQDRFHVRYDGKVWIKDVLFFKTLDEFKKYTLV